MTLTPRLRKALDEMIADAVPGRVQEAVAAALPASALTPELREALSDVVADEVPQAVHAALGLAPAPAAVDAAAGALCEAVAGVQREDLAHAASALPDQLVADLAGDVDEALLEMAVEDTLRADAAANAAALRLLESRLQRVLASPRDVREAAVREALDAERVRLRRRESGRFVRALSHLHGERVHLLSELEAS